MDRAQKLEEVRRRHEEGVAKLDALFGYDRKRDGTGFLKAHELRQRRWFRFRRR